MSIRKSDNGEALGLVPDMLVVSPQNKATAAAILNNQFIAVPQMGGIGTGAVGTANGPLVGASDNPLTSWTDQLVVPDFSSTAAIQKMWLMLQTKNMPVKPLSWLLRAAPIVTPRTAPSDPVVFDTHQFVYGVEARGAPAWSLPFLGSISGPTAV
jgi:phage major head subunit gpT-like protein